MQCQASPRYCCPGEFDVATVMVTHDTEFVPLADAVAAMRDWQLTAPVPAAV